MKKQKRKWGNSYVVETVNGRKKHAVLFQQILGILRENELLLSVHIDIVVNLEPSFIFGKGGTRKAASEMGLEFVGEIPLELEIRKGFDEGIPVVVAASNSAVSKAYGSLAQNVINRLEELSNGKPPPEIVL
ncbi:iron-sulfur cluster carrier protein-like [Juglans microcarpa x Juglans regia]|uniref:iron-sulfur cluster carrier protein-like n=1 Tax=Juglans microcarpa x Juglans regia TaxID=2249226 RepID=UPI001B7ECD7B|nr:iron-sulfur cluster carrier protein-like [Juglans microcarpa x Juglans regia]